MRRCASDGRRFGSEEDGEAVPCGQKLLLVDGEECPLLEVREIQFGSS